MGQAVNFLDCEVAQLRAETSSLRQLNSQLVGELESTREAAATGEKKLEEVVGNLRRWWANCLKQRANWKKLPLPLLPLHREKCCGGLKAKIRG